MLNILRKLRHKEMKGSKYLKYAIGEIVLVVIGILIALSLNNWNDSYQTAKKENALLKKVNEENLYNIGFVDENGENLKNLDQRISELYTALSKPRSKKTDEEVENLMLDIIQISVYTFSTQYLDRYINNSEYDESELIASLVGLKDDLTTLQKGSELTYNYQLAKIWPFIEKGFSMVTYNVIDHEALRDPVFINRLVVLEFMSTSNYDNFKLTKDKSEKIDSLITVRLAQ